MYAVCTLCLGLVQYLDEMLNSKLLQRTAVFLIPLSVVSVSGTPSCFYNKRNNRIMLELCPRYYNWGYLIKILLLKKKNYEVIQDMKVAICAS